MRPAERVLESIDPLRLKETAYRLVSIPSPTGSVETVAALFAELLRSLDLEVETVREMPGTAVIVGRLVGGGPGPTLELNGHLDTVPLEHPPPTIEGDLLYARGAVDMKGQMACFLEVLAALRDSGIRLAGDVLVTAHGLHENPGRYQHSEDRLRLLRAGLKGDACFIPDSLEGSVDALPIVYGGMSVFKLTLARNGEALHELEVEPGTPNPLVYLARLSERLQDLNARFRENPLELLGADSYHVGVIRGGDYFNLHPNAATMEGTRRYGPGTSAEQAREQLIQTIAELVDGSGLSVDLDFKGSEPYSIAESEPLVVSVKESYRNVTGRELPLRGVRCAGDVTMFGTLGGVPAVNHSARGGGHHGNPEWVDLKDLGRLARVLAGTTVAYCGLAQ